MKIVNDINIRDPFVLNKNGTYYLYSAYVKDEKNCFVCYKSKDLIEFSDPKVIFMENNNFWGEQDFWAPEVHEYKGKYYLFASFKAKYKCRGTSILVCDTPDGEFIPLKNGPVTPENWECLDGTLYVENNIPYMFFCREWLEVKDGEMYGAQLSEDLSNIIGEPKLLFTASKAGWTKSIRGEDSFVTDGPYIFKRDGYYNMIWSSFSKKGYALGLAKSKSLLDGWINLDQPIYDENGGHGMVFNKDDEQCIAIHQPNNPGGSERLKVIPLNQLIK